MDYLRLFTAVRPSEAALDRAVAAQRALAKRVGDRTVRWIPRESLHVTLHFLGATEQSKVDDVFGAMSDVAAGAPGAIPLETAGVGAFPSARRPRTLWTGVGDPSGRLAEIEALLNSAMRRLGFSLDDRPFRPHVTIGKVRKAAGKSELAAVGTALQELVPEPVAFEAHEILLVRSVLERDGARYSDVRSVPL
ncbi:MAG: RNA 2',3'-cyclic phosphodiesterase [Spirochaetota bacterium]